MLLQREEFDQIKKKKKTKLLCDKCFYFQRSYYFFFSFVFFLLKASESVYFLSTFGLSGKKQKKKHFAVDTLEVDD